MLGSEPDLQMHVKNVKSSLPKIGDLKTAYFVTVFDLTKLCKMMLQMFICGCTNKHYNFLQRVTMLALQVALALFSALIHVFMRPIALL